jgi:hypothetical protein
MWGGDVALAATCGAYGRALDVDERLVLEHHAVTVAVWDVVHATRSPNRGHLLADEVAILRRVLRR